jgi:DNA-binding NtrC family response regulator
VARLLIAEDEERMRRLLSMLLANANHEMDLAADGKEAFEKYEAQRPDLIITDLRMPRESGMDLIRNIRAVDPDTPIIVITAFGSIESAVDAMQAGATDYVTKPFEEARIKLAIERALERRELVAENKVLRTELRSRYAFDALVAESHRFLRVLESARAVAATNTTAMIYGESGTGKELVSRAIHEASPRARGPFIALNCAAIPENLLESELFGHERGSFTGATDARKGRFEMADGGTLFLDEIGEMDLSLQAKVLRAIESRQFERVGGTRTISTDVRFIAATNKNLRQRVAEGKFRDDLFYRLNVFPVVIPPLRDRIDDIMPLAEYFLDRFAREMGKKVPSIPLETQKILLSHRWLGNVRELQNVIERAMILLHGDSLLPELVHIDALDGLEAMASVTAEYESQGPSLGPRKPANDEADAATGVSASPPSIPRWHPFRIPEVGFDLETHERELIEQALERSGHNKSAAAKMLGLSRATLRYRLDKFGLGQDEPPAKVKKK